MPAIDWSQVLACAAPSPTSSCSCCSASSCGVPIATIIGWSHVFNYLSFRFTLPQPLCIVKDGVKQDAALERELISDEELREMLREQEVEDIAEVRRAYLEPDGQVTVIRRRGGSSDGKRRRVF